MDLTNEQKEIVYANINKNILVESDAGCGKTFCIVERVKFLIEKGIKPEKIQVLAFNKAISCEIVKKLYDVNILNVNVETIDSFVLQYISPIYNVKPLLNLNVKNKQDKMVVSKFYTTFDTSKKIFVDNFHRIKPKITSTHFIFDECQDLTHYKFRIFQLLKNNGYKVFAVGDKKQKINGYSEPDKIEEESAIWESFGTNDLKFQLTTSFRTNKNILNETNKIFRTRTSSNITDCNYDLIRVNGELEQLIDYYKTRIKKQFRENSVKILCRKNKEVFDINSQLLDLSDSEIIKYKKLAEEFIKQVLKIDRTKEKFPYSVNMTELRNFYDELENDELKNYFYETIGTMIKAHERIELLSSNNTYYNFIYLNATDWDINSIDNDEQLIYYFTDLFMKKNLPNKYFPATTIHKSKGLEWPIVLVYHSKGINQNIADEEEMNLFYVACTRAKNSLIIFTPQNISSNILHIIETFNFRNNDNTNISIKDINNDHFLVNDAAEEAELNIDFHIHPASGFGSTLHLLIQKYVNSSGNPQFERIYPHSDNFFYKSALDKYRSNLKIAYEKITALIEQKQKQGFKVYSEYKLYCIDQKKETTTICKLDLLFVKDDKIQIVDIKSSNSNDEPNEAYKKQLNLYKKAIELRFKGSTVNCEFYMFNKDKNSLRVVKL